MTVGEYQEKLNSLSDAEVEKFCKDFGGGRQTREQLVRSFVDHPEYERRICQLLRLKSENEKVTYASVESAKAAASSASSARISIVLAAIAVIVSIISLIFSIKK